MAQVCSATCALEYAQKNRKKKEELAEKAEKRERKKRLDELKPVKFYLDKAQVWFNKFIRMRDAGLACISCGKPDNGQHQRHASHFRSRGACSSLRFDENNVHASCSVCNNHLSGNIAGYTDGLIDKIGHEEYKRIVNSPKSKKWTKEEAKEIEEKYKKKCKELASI